MTEMPGPDKTPNGPMFRDPRTWLVLVPLAAIAVLILFR